MRPESSMPMHSQELDLKITDNGMPTGEFLLLTCLRQILKSELSISREYFTFFPHMYICWSVKVYIKSALKWQEMVGLQMTN